MAAPVELAIDLNSGVEYEYIALDGNLRAKPYSDITLLGTFSFFRDVRSLS